MRKERARINNETEHSLQVSCVNWFNLQYPQFKGILFAVPNGGHRAIRTAVTMKAEGVVSGVADLILLVGSGGYNSLCIEMKRPKGGRQSNNQKEWQKIATKFGNKYVIVNSFEQFRAEIKKYLENLA